MTGQFCGSEVERAWGGFLMFPRLRANSSCHVIYIHFLLGWLKNTKSCFIRMKCARKATSGFLSASAYTKRVWIAMSFCCLLLDYASFHPIFLRSEDESWRSEIQTAIRHSQTFALLAFTFFMQSTGNRKKPFFVLRKTFTQIQMAYQMEILTQW